MSESLDNNESVKTEATVLTEERVYRNVKPNNFQAVRKGNAARPPGFSRTPRKEDDDDDESFFQRNKAVLIFGVIVLGGIGWLVFSKPFGTSGPVHKAQEQQIVKIVLPPPPPPPPPKATPPPPPPKEDKRPEQAPLAAPDKPAVQPKPAEKPPEGLGTNIKGAGPGLAGLSGGGGNGMIGGTGTGPGGGSQWGLYAGQVQARIAEALRNNSRTRSASINLKVRVWPDSSGKISRAELSGTTGNAELDNAIRNEVLTGLNLSESPPQGMPVPITLKLVARRPN